MKLYEELSKAEAGLVLGEPLHLTYIIMLEHPFQISGWQSWEKLFGGLPDMHKKASLLHAVCLCLQHHVVPKTGMIPGAGTMLLKHGTCGCMHMQTWATCVINYLLLCSVFDYDVQLAQHSSTGSSYGHQSNAHTDSSIVECSC